MASDDWDGFKEHKRAVNQQRRDRNTKYIERVTGFSKTAKTPYQFRFSHDSVGDFIDLYPTNAKYHNLITGERGHYKTAQGFLERQLERTQVYLSQRTEASK